jgi:hypothetical protein
LGKLRKPLAKVQVSTTKQNACPITFTGLIMALIVEDGTGKAGAESYAEVAEVDLYHSNRGTLSWSLLDQPTKEQCLRKATDYMVAEYRMRWKGQRRTVAQALDWPRVGVISPDFASNLSFRTYGLIQVLFNVVPPEVKKACAELAYRASIGELSPDLTQGVKTETVGPISVTYDSNSPQHIRYVHIENTLAVYMINSNSSMVKLTRT